MFHVPAYIYLETPSISNTTVSTPLRLVSCQTDGGIACVTDVIWHPTYNRFEKDYIILQLYSAFLSGASHRIVRKRLTSCSRQTTFLQNVCKLIPDYATPRHVPENGLLHHHYCAPNHKFRTLISLRSNNEVDMCNWGGISCKVWTKFTYESAV